MLTSRLLFTEAELQRRMLLDIFNFFLFQLFLGIPLSEFRNRNFFIFA